jgi:acetyl-CoA carboxylase biotin carboxyl carrier protein
MNMDIKEIHNLIKFVSKAGVNEVSIEQGDFKITIKTDGGATGVFDGPVQQVPVAVQHVPQQMVVQPAQVAAAQPKQETPAATSAESNYITIKSPMIGTFYRRSSPDKEAFKNVGDTVSPGDVICIIEAMKLFNEIESEVSGRVVKVLVDDTSPIEYDQPLFLIDPAG